ncbi:polyprenyl synthetase family protein [Candidatus Woesebacteria bacterium]|nr:polyprenyl synthetase family protein [Candidatus Woesebacteria bacterium]
MTFIEFISQHRAQLESFINTCMDAKIATSPMHEAKNALQKVKDCVTDGKMIRGMLVLLGAEIHGKTIDEEVFATASAIEIFHTGLLIHDDIMDNDFKRRNKESVFYQYMKEGEQYKAKNPLLYGQSMGLCVGDICFFLGFEILTKYIVDNAILRSIVQITSEEFQLVGPAQMADTAHGMTATEPNEVEIYKKYLYKTAHYSFSVPLILGSLFGVKQDISLLKQFGEDVGIIFQLKDDDLGIFGNEQDIGKQIGSDIRENKKTLLRWYTFKNAIGKDKQQLLSIFGKSTISTDELRFVRESVERYHGRTLINREIEKRLDRIHETLTALAQAGLSTEILQDLVKYNLIRNK